jgi:hypothetical protein
LHDTPDPRLVFRLNHSARRRDQPNRTGEAIMLARLDYDLGSLAVLMIGICSVALLAAMSV